MKRLIWFVFILMVTGLGSAWAQGSAPDVVRGKYVYAIPAGFDPPLIGRSGMAEIQKAAQKLRFPYYVVLVEQFNGETDEDAAAFIDSIAERWQKDPDFNSGKSSIFLLSYSPRKFRFLAGSYWESKLGFDAAAHAPYNAIFESYVQRSRKDPKTGIIMMMQAVDQHLFIESDPKVIAKRREAARKAEIVRLAAEKKAREEAALQMARDQLNTEAADMDSLLSNDSRFLPPDVAKYIAARESVNSVIQGNDRNKMLSEATGLRLKNNELRTFVDAKLRDAREREQRIASQVGGIVLALILVILIIVTRVRKYGKLKREFGEESKLWEEKILNAQPKYLEFDHEREMIAGLKELIGRTKEVYESTTREVDDIFISIGALQAHIDECKSTAKRASFLNFKPLEQAIASMESEFTFDTTQLNKADLFAPETRQVTLKPVEIAEQLEERFRSTLEQWNHLKKAAEVRFHQVEEVFPQSRLDEMLKAADENGIPHRWLADHPLFGDDASDKTLYTRINEGRMNDPVAYLERIEELQNKESEAVDRLNRLVKSLTMIKAIRVDSVPDLEMTVLQPQDDPKITLDAAKREEARFTAMLTSRDDVAEVEAQAVKVQELYRKCIEQTGMAQAAIKAAKDDIDSARALLDNVTALAQDSEAQVKARQQIHSNMADAGNSLINGRRYLEAGASGIESASALLTDRKHLEAQTAALRAKTQLETAKSEFEHCKRQCEELDEAKRCFDERFAELAYRQEQAESRIRRYGGSTIGLQRFDYSPRNSAMDYFLLLSQMDTIESSWESDVRNARTQYEEQERERSSSISSSSGSSWSSGGSSSSGGSWGGGSSSSSSSSSGGSW